MMEAYPFIYKANYDGDTITGDIKLELSCPIPNIKIETTMLNQVIRLLGVDAPELKGSDLENKAGKLIRNYVKTWFSQCNFTLIETEWNYDKYGRLLADFKQPGVNTSLSRNLLLKGFALSYQGEAKLKFTEEILNHIISSF